MYESPQWDKLATAAWEVRDHAMVWGKTKVGAAVETKNGQIYIGTNIEAKLQLGIHAEIAALSAMVSFDDRNPRKILIAANRELFTPCGGCMDWIMQLGGPEVEIAFSSGLGNELRIFTAAELMPHYPH